MKIIIGCSQSNKLGSRLIRWWTGVPYSHVYAMWHVGTQNRDIVYHASHGMVHFVNYENFKKHNTIVKEFELNIGQRQFIEFSKACIDLAGEQYSALELAQIFISDITNGKIRTQDLPGYICSELMCELLEKFFKAKFDKPRYMITPKDIMEFLEKHLYGKTRV